MLYNFDTDNVNHARAAVLIYAMYRSRGTNSPMNGLETWDRVESACVGACKKSRTTSEFVTKFKEIAKVGAIKPRYLSCGSRNGMQRMPDGSVIESPNIKEFHAEILEDDTVRRTIEKDYPLITLLVRERIQREKYIMEEEENEEYCD